MRCARTRPAQQQFTIRISVLGPEYVSFFFIRKERYTTTTHAHCSHAPAHSYNKLQIQMPTHTLNAHTPIGHLAHTYCTKNKGEKMIDASVCVCVCE